MKRYEGLYILNTSSRDEGIKEMIDRITADIAAVGGKVETIQKMDKRGFARVASKKHTAGFYVNIIFTCEPAGVAQLHHRFALHEDVFRVMFTTAPPPLGEPPAAPGEGKSK
jgi:ribosomal protein S6